ncbi:MAG: right-handed parallel beta-helix repeat-containing protein [Planctomycetota bacterium]
MHFRQWVIIAICCVQVMPLWARDIYVNNVAGRDRNDGTAAEASTDGTGPYRTITRALRAAQKGDRVVLANTGKPYRESITLQGGKHGGIGHIPFELIGNDAVLDGTRPVPVSAWMHHTGTIFRFRPPKISFQLLYLDGKPAERREVGSLGEIEDLDRLQWCLFKQHVYFRVEDGRLPQTYELSFTDLQVGITLYQVRHVVIRDLVIQGFQLDGVNAHDGVYNVTLSGLNSRGNARSGISIGGASQVRVQACLVGNNGAAQVRAEGACRAHLEGCDLLDNTAPRIVRDGGQVVVNP